MKMIGIIGLIGSGKDEVVNTLHEQCGVPKLSTGDIVRQVADSEGIEPTRANLHRISQRCLEQYGRDYFARQIIDRIAQAEWDAVGITGLRTPTDVESLRQQYGEDFLLVHIEVTDSHIRWERTRARNEPRDRQTYEEFRRQEEEEEELFHLHQACQMADLTINNDDSLQEFRRKIKTQVIEQELAGTGVCKEPSKHKGE